jgi:4-hydroxybenzoate polyprenyltransferase
MKNIVYLLISMRPAQWIKNLIIFAGLIFAREYLNIAAVSKVTLAFILFCILTGCNYLLNDIKDRKKDKLHPKKSLRPVPAGKLPVILAFTVAIIGIALSIALSFLLSVGFGAIASAYIVLMILYSLFFKEMAVVDAIVIAVGFVLRAVAGVVVIKVELSPWLFICAFLLALFIVFSKRRHELITLDARAVSHRKILRDYSPVLLDQMIMIVSATTLISYILYTLWPDTIVKFGTRNLVYTVPFVMYGLFRYLYLVYKKEEAGSPEKALLTDPPILITIAVWIASVLAIINWFK